MKYQHPKDLEPQHLLSKVGVTAYHRQYCHFDTRGTTSKYIRIAQATSKRYVKLDFIWEEQRSNI